MTLKDLVTLAIPLFLACPLLRFEVVPLASECLLPIDVPFPFFLVCRLLRFEDDAAPLVECHPFILRMQENNSSKMVF